MRIKKYKEFIKESTEYEFGCVMLEVPVSNWDEITSSIDPNDIYTDEDKPGISKDPHITLLYGYDNSIIPEMVENILKNFIKEPIEVEIEGIGLFENKTFDVVKFNIKKSEILQKLYDELSKLPNSNKFKNFTPHITIAYVKKGTGKKYVREYKHKVTVDTICYSMTNGEEIKFEV
jgi:2'-5' RNA ligase